MTSLSKVESLCAVVEVYPNWYGILYSHADGGKKKSNLMLSLFKPGLDPVPWIGNVRYVTKLDSSPVPATGYGI